MIWYAAPTPPEGFIECNGQSTVAYPALAAVVGATVPDLRGRFIRGWDHSAGIDLNRSFLSFQEDELKSHTHQMPYGKEVGGTGPGVGTHAGWAWSTGYVANTGGVETRPKNISLLPCIKY